MRGALGQAIAMVDQSPSDVLELDKLLQQALTAADALELGLVALKISEALDQLRLHIGQTA